METAIKTEQRAVTTYVDEYTLVLTLSLKEAQVLYKKLWDDDLKDDEIEVEIELRSSFHRLLSDIQRVPITSLAEAHSNV